MRKTGGVISILAAYGILALSGVFAGPSAAMLFNPARSTKISFGLLFLGLLGGAAGAALIALGVKLCRREDEAALPVSPWSVIGFGLFYPGAAQAYAGRWLWAAFFLLLPWAIINVCLVAAVAVGVIARFLPFFSSVTPLLTGIMGICMPSKLFYFILWAASLAEGYRWAIQIEPNPPPAPMPRWRAPVIGLGAVIYSFIFLLLMQAVFVGYTLRVGVFLKGGKLESAKASGKPAEQADSSSRDDKPRTTEEYRKAAEQGDAAAQFKMGQIYLRGEGVLQDMSLAAGWYLKAAQQGHPEAQFNAGLLCAKGQGGIPKDDAKAAEWYLKSATQGLAVAQYELGRALLRGAGVPPDKSAAAGWIRKAAEQGNARAEFDLGQMYSRGDGVPGDLGQAGSWWLKAAEQGHSGAQFNIGLLYAKGQGGMPKDDARAVAFYRKAAEQGFANAEYSLGIMYDKGRGVAQDYAEAFKWYAKAAGKGDSDAQTSLGIMYQKGLGVQKNDAQAVEFFRKAAEQEDAGGQVNLGLCYADGRGVRKSLVTAAKFYREAAEQGDMAGMHNLGAAYIYGRGVKKDVVEGYKWIYLAAQKGEPNSRQALIDLAPYIQPRQVSEAKRRAAAFQKEAP
ncbi:MAG: SEL1-like repeat protein [Elusimicrobiota bacterium]|nr:SEL1-like repeat protein [Elusimicrobiota bacterium]